MALSHEVVAQLPPAADLVLYSGRVILVDSTERVAQAVAVRDGRIAAVGTNEQVQR